MDILVIGGGGREHAICHALKKSKRCGKLYCMPGNAGIAELAECHPHIKATDSDAILSFLEAHKNVEYIVVAPDDPLYQGLVNKLTEAGHRAFGPTAEAAIIEGSKAFSKNLMQKYGIPTAAYAVFSDYNEAAAYVKTQKLPLVIKADGLALGKGVLICETWEDVDAALRAVMVSNMFGDAGKKVVIEEFLRGKEVSVLCFTDGKTIVPMVSSQDHKRALDGDKGLNTGGMGTFSPSKFYTADMAERVNKFILQPTVAAMNSEGRTFKGVLYVGLMIDGDDIRVLEYNARFGDPETQVVLPLLKTDLVDVMEACTDGTLDRVDMQWSKSSCVCVILASGGYPQIYAKGKKITIAPLDRGVTLYHSGTARDSSGNLITSGGRVIGVVAKGRTIEAARKLVYANVKRVQFENVHYRNDIGYKL